MWGWRYGRQSLINNTIVEMDQFQLLHVRCAPCNHCPIGNTYDQLRNNWNWTKCDHIHADIQDTKLSLGFILFLISVLYMCIRSIETYGKYTLMEINC